MKKRLTMILACLFLFVGMAVAQTAVTGTVVSKDDGEPVIGATVKVVGTHEGAVTDVNGVFTVRAKEGDNLEFSYIGMKTIRVKASKNMKVLLESDDNILENVVVTGYGSARKLGTIAGSVSTVSGRDIENRPVANVGDAMQGQVAGLQVFTSSGEPSVAASMTIRGVTSINASTEPLYILDGSEISSQAFLSLNPNDIENITVLKDASSTAIYGSRAANGVIIVSTKRAKFDEKTTVTVSAQYGISRIANEGLDVMNANQWLDFQEIVNPSYANDASFQAMKEYYKKYNIGTDWQKKYLGHSAPTSQIDISVRGGSHNTSYLLSYGHFDADGIFNDSYMRRETLRANIETNITSWLKIGSNTNLAYIKQMQTMWGENGTYDDNSSISIYNKTYAAHRNLPTQPDREILGLAYYPDGTIDYANSTFEGYGDELNYYDMMAMLSPDYLAKVQPITLNKVRINENAFVNINPIKGLNLRTALGVDWNDTRQSGKMYNFIADGLGDLNPTGSASESFSRVYRWTVTNTAEYKFDFLRKHSVTFLLGQESMTYKAESFGISVNGLTDNRLMLISAAPSTGVSVPSHSISEEVRNSWFGMLNYSFADRYYVDLSLRRDGSSLFAKDHRWGTFGAAAVMWNITGENFMRPLRSWLNDLKLKASYGSTGNSGINPYQAIGLVGAGSSYNGAPGTAIATPGNSDLTWEKVKTFNLGLSGRVLNRIDFDLQYYNKVTSDMLFAVPFSFTTGFSAGTGNICEMRNRGFDFNIGVDIIKNKDWYWNVKVNGNYNSNKITKLLPGQDTYEYGSLAQLEVGHPLGEFYMVRWSHVDPQDGQSVWLDKDGNETKIYSEANRVQTGKQSIAPWSGGLMTTVAWKGLQLDIQFSGMFDRYMWNRERNILENPSRASSTNVATNLFNMWQKPGDITSVPAADCERQLDTQFLEDASFIRLKFMQLSYTLPEKWLKATNFIKGAKIYVTGRNLLTFTDFQGYDPEVDAMYSQGVYPNSRQYSIGAQITF